MFGGDFLKYTYDRDHGTKIDEDLASHILDYSHGHWESKYGTNHADQDVKNGKLCLPGLTSRSTSQCPAAKEKKASTRCLSEDSASPIMSMPLSVKAVVVEVEDDTDAVNLQAQPSALQCAVKKATTRAEVAAFYHILPLVACRPSANISPVYGRLSTSDPFSLHERPCENDIKKARKLLSYERKAGRTPSGIKIEGKGEFSETSLSVLNNFCRIAETYHKVSSETPQCTLLLIYLTG